MDCVLYKVDLTSMRKYKNLSKQKMAEKERELLSSIAEITVELESMQVENPYILITILIFKI